MPFGHGIQRWLGYVAMFVFGSLPEKTPLCGVACQNIAAEVFKNNNVPEGVSCMINGDYKVGEMMTQDSRVPLISATGSIRMGKIVAQAVAATVREIASGIRRK